MRRVLCGAGLVLLYLATAAVLSLVFMNIFEFLARGTGVWP